jgi:hypothetical protein
MKTVILILALASKAVAFKQIYAVNSGGKALTDSDGIKYQARVSGRYNFIAHPKFDFSKVPESDRNIYKSFAFVR